MLAFLLTVALIAQGPGGGEFAIASGFDSASVGLVVRGTVELSPGEADLSAQALATERARALLADRGRAVLAESCPAWLPVFCREQMLRRWLGGADPSQAVRIVDRRQAEHDHGGLGTSYRTELVVAPDGRSVSRLLSSLRRQIAAGSRLFAVKCASIVGFWLLLAAAIGWLDRLSRGYMTWRLRLLGAIAGSALPALVLLLV